MPLSIIETNILTLLTHWPFVYPVVVNALIVVEIGVRFGKGVPGMAFKVCCFGDASC